MAASMPSKFLRAGNPAYVRLQEGLGQPHLCTCIHKGVKLPADGHVCTRMIHEEIGPSIMQACMSLCL
eukprot:359855-Chlamydomonas_euryale.AAC.1